MQQIPGGAGAAATRTGEAGGELQQARGAGVGAALRRVGDEGVRDCGADAAERGQRHRPARCAVVEPGDEEAEPVRLRRLIGRRPRRRITGLTALRPRRVRVTLRPRCGASTGLRRASPGSRTAGPACGTACAGSGAACSGCGRASGPPTLVMSTPLVSISGLTVHRRRPPARRPAGPPGHRRPGAATSAEAEPAGEPAQLGGERHRHLPGLGARARPRRPAPAARRPAGRP